MCWHDDSAKAEMYLHQDVTGIVIGCFYKVYNALGFGFFEHVYVNALMLELVKHDLKAVKSQHVYVYYDNHVVGDFIADIIINDAVIIDVKTAPEYLRSHEARIINHLKASGKPVGILLNFGRKAEFKRLANYKRERDNEL